MISENPLFLLPALTGVIFILAGYFLFKFPPKNINWLYGYRTKNSMRTQERWDFAQLYSAKEIIKAGAILVLLALASLFVQVNELAGLFIAIGVLIAVVIIMLVRVEKALKDKFGEVD